MQEQVQVQVQVQVLQRVPAWAPEREQAPVVGPARVQAAVQVLRDQLQSGATQA